MPWEVRLEISVSKKVSLKVYVQQESQQEERLPIRKTKVDMCGGRCRDLKGRDGG